MRDLFRSFEDEELPYLLIGGQASILYGASQFTQDVDLWIHPSTASIAKLLRALARLDARVHKLTPPVQVGFVRRGHGFHFVVPRSGESDLYLDVMGRPPRVGSFASAHRRSKRLATPWGKLPVVAIEDLVELKKTDRPGDYEVISRLARARLGREAKPARRLVAWALSNAFRLDDLRAIVAACRHLIGSSRSDQAVEIVVRAHDDGERPLTPEESDAAADLLADRAREAQRAGRAYWRPRIGELRELRAAGGLLAPGTPVARLVPR